MKLREIIYDTEYNFSDADREINIKKITTNIEDVEEDTLLVIPNISRLNNEVCFATPPVAIISDKTDKFPEDIPKIIPKNPRAAVANALFRFYKIDLSRFKTVAITGTNGKTSTARFIQKICKEIGKRVGYIGTGTIEIGDKKVTEENYSMTTPDPETLYKVLRQMQDEGCDTVIIEVSSHSLALEKVAPLTFDYAVFTNFSNEHLDFHKSKEDYFEAKSSLFNKCKTAVFNIDDSYARRALEISGAKKNITVGALQRGDVYATHIENRGLDGVSYLYRAKDFMFRMKLQTPGIYNVYNSMLAATVCIDMGCPPYLAKEAIGKLEALPGRFEVISDDVTVIIDFAHTDTAFSSFLREAKSIAASNTLSVIFGCGGERDKEKRPKMAHTAEKFADKITVTSDNPRNENPDDIIKDIVQGFVEKKHHIIPDRKLAIEKTILTARRGDVIAIIGKGAEKYMIDKKGYRHFDEREIIAEALQKRRAMRKCESN